MIKVVTAQEMVRIEKWAIEQGSSEKAFMQEAGTRVAAAAIQLLQKRPGNKVVLLVGKGNKGGDAYVAGIHLLQAGFHVRAILFGSSLECSELNQHFAKQFRGLIDTELDFSKDDLIIDGLLGTGFHGKLEGPISHAIQLATKSGKPILAIDLPSGLDGTTGKGEAIVATETVTLGLPKAGLFRHSGWNCTGRLHIEDFGLPQAAIEEAQAVAWVPQLEALKLPPMVRSHHKYERGFVIGFGGSHEYKGAVKLSGKGALHAGAGIVKLFTLEDVGPTDDELIIQPWSLSVWGESLRKASAVFIGPGLGVSPLAKERCKAALQHIDKPCVIDADALKIVPEIQLPKQCILTPHRGEMLRLLGVSTNLEEDTLLSQSQNYVERHAVVLVLKGAPTYIFSAGQLPIIIPHGDPGMATAGSGDVLTGILAALLAQGQSVLDAAVLGVTLHALAGEAAAFEKTSYGYTASDLIDFLPKAFMNFV